jgi:hypothetical protein
MDRSPRGRSCWLGWPLVRYEDFAEGHNPLAECHGPSCLFNWTGTSSPVSSIDHHVWRHPPLHCLLCPYYHSVRTQHNMFFLLPVGIVSLLPAWCMEGTRASGTTSSRACRSMCTTSPRGRLWLCSYGASMWGDSWHRVASMWDESWRNSCLGWSVLKPFGACHNPAAGWDECHGPWC